MNKFLIFTFTILFLSCKFKDEKKITEFETLRDSSLLYYNTSLEKNLSLFKKKQAINKSFLLAKNLKKDTLYSTIIYQKSLIHYNLQEYDSLLLFSNLLLKNTDLNKKKLGRQYYLKAYYYDKIAKIADSAFLNYNLSKNQFQQIKDSSWVGVNLLGMGIIQKNQNDFFGSKETLTEALQYLNAEKDSNSISSAYSTLAINHRKLLNFDDGIKYVLKAMNHTKSSKEALIAYKNNLATIYIDNKDYDEAIKVFQEILSDSILKKQSSQYARILDNLGYVEWLSNKNKTEKKLVEALHIRIKNNDTRGLIASYTHLGEFYSENLPSKATSYFDSVINLSKSLKIPKAEKDAIKYLMALKPNNIRLKDRYVFLQDSLYTQELKVKTQFAKYKYDDKAKQESILRLQKEKAEEQLKVTNQRNQKTIALFGLILLFLASFSIYIFFKQRTNSLKEQNKLAKLEATFETEAELSRKLHDDFGGKLNHTMLLVQNDAKKSELLDSLESLYNQSRDFSREINEVDTGSNYKSELIQMLNTYKLKETKLVLVGSKEIEWSKINGLTKTTLHKILRELMINMTKYSQATVVTLSFKKMSKGLQINYSDNGIGASKINMNTKNGLRNTEKRIRAIGGTIIFETEKGKGFKAEIKTPN